jgi:regulatory helix-turn-helix LysR family protein
MEVPHLRYFVAVAEELHFRRAAERLHVAHPAVSQQVRKLAQGLGVKLFDCRQRTVEHTVAGAALLEEARQVLGHRSGTTGRAQRRRPGDHAAAHRLPARLAPRASSRRAISREGLHVGAAQLRPYGRANSSIRRSNGACCEATSPRHLAHRHGRRRRSYRSLR